MEEAEIQKLVEERVNRIMEQSIKPLLDTVSKLIEVAPGEKNQPGEKAPEQKPQPGGGMEGVSDAVKGYIEDKKNDKWGGRSLNVREDGKTV